MNMIRWMCGIKMKRKRSEKPRELLELEPIHLMIKNSRLDYRKLTLTQTQNSFIRFRDRGLGLDLVRARIKRESANLQK